MPETTAAGIRTLIGPPRFPIIVCCLDRTGRRGRQPACSRQMPCVGLILVGRNDRLPRGSPRRRSSIRRGTLCSRETRRRSPALPRVPLERFGLLWKRESLGGDEHTFFLQFFAERRTAASFLTTCAGFSTQPNRMGLVDAIARRGYAAPCSPTDEWTLRRRASKRSHSRFTSRCGASIRCVPSRSPTARKRG